MTFKRSLFFIHGFFLLLSGLFSSLAQAEPKVVVSIKPIHSLVAGLMHNVGEPYLLLKSNQSPHNMSLRPSDARALDRADLIIWVGPMLESSLSRLLHAREESAKVVTLLDTPALRLLPIRNSLDWDSHRHSNHQPLSEEHHDPDKQEWDSHIWLSPDNARQMVHYLTEALIRLDAPNRDKYLENSQSLLDRLKTMEEDLTKRIAKVRERPFIVFHDAYHYLEQHFQLNAVGSVSISPERLSGARHIHELRNKIRRLNAHCVFTEPQFEPRLVHTLVEGTQARIGELDPLGGNLPAGADAYFKLMQRLSENLAECLGGDQ